MKEIEILLDELILLMAKKKITVKQISIDMKISRATVDRVIDGKGKMDRFAEVLEYCRNYKVK